MAFKTQEEIWKHLLNGGMVKDTTIGKIYHFKNGFIHILNGDISCRYFDNVDKFEVYEEPEKYELEVEFRLCSACENKVFPVDIHKKYNHLGWTHWIGKKFKMTLEEIEE